MKKPCKNCPFKKATKPYLTPERAAEISFAAQNPYNRFPCHKTIKYGPETDEDGQDVADMTKAKPCAGFATLQAQYRPDEVPEGFKPSYSTCYETASEMSLAYKKAAKK